MTRTFIITIKLGYYNYIFNTNPIFSRWITARIKNIGNRRHVIIIQ